jgi:hypothetical protein
MFNKKYIFILYTYNEELSVGKLFTKGGNSIAKGAKSIFSKNTANTFRNHLQDTQEQGRFFQPWAR